MSTVSGVTDETSAALAAAAEDVLTAPSPIRRARPGTLRVRSRQTTHVGGARFQRPFVVVYLLTLYLYIYVMQTGLALLPERRAPTL
jgi:hypothetical protein